MIFFARLRNSFATKAILIIISISISYLLGGENRNLLLIGMMSLSPITIIRYPYIYKIDIILILLLTTMIISSAVFNPISLRWSTILYSIMFCLTFMGYVRVLSESSLEILDYLKIIKCLIYAYCIVLIIQQCCVLFHLPILNVSNYNIFNPWKLNTLSPEPSHSAVYLGILMYCYLTIKEYILKRKYNLQYDFRNDGWIWGCFLWSMITMISGTAMLYLSIICLKLCNKKYIAIILLSAFITSPLLLNSNFKPLKRTASTIKSTLTLNEKEIIKADLSAAFRIVPSVIAIKNADITNAKTWTGKGIDYMKNDLINQMPAVNKNTKSISTAFTLGVDYGILFFLIWSIFTFLVCTERTAPISYILWFFSVMLNGINVQLVWFAIIFLYTNKYFTANDYKNYACFRDTPGSYQDGTSC